MYNNKYIFSAIETSFEIFLMLLVPRLKCEKYEIKLKLFDLPDNRTKVRALVKYLDTMEEGMNHQICLV